MKFNCLIVGESGVGKTPLAATLADCEQTQPCLFLDVDAGSMSIITEPKPTIFEIDTWSQVQKIYTLLRDQKWEELAKLVVTEQPLEYKSVVIDSGTELEYKLRKHVMSETGSSEMPEQRDYLICQERFRSLYRKFRDLPLTIVMTAGVRDLKEDISGIVKYYPAFQPGLTRDLVRMTDLVLFMDVKSEDKKWLRVLQTQITQRVVARDRSQKLSAQIRGEKLFFKDIVKEMIK